MDSQLEEVREIWANAFYIGHYEVLRQYEHEDFKVVFEQKNRVETSYVRYDRIAHAVKNGVWKPHKPEVEYEDYKYNADQTECCVVTGLAKDKHRIQELWRYENEWKIIELRFLKS